MSVSTKPRELGLRQQIVAHSGVLSKQQRVIADFLLEQLQDIPFLSIFQVAEKTGTSEATVVRLCQRIGYQGFSELKMAMVDMLREESSAAPGPVAESGTGDGKTDHLAAMGRLGKLNIQRTVEQNDHLNFDAVTQAIEAADHVFTFGLGVSALLADLASYILTEHGIRATSLGARFTSPREQLVSLRGSDLVIAFSLPPYSKPTLELLTELGQRQIPSVTITDRATAPSVALAKHTLLVSCEGMTFTNTISAVDVLLNALAVNLASRSQSDSMRALSEINQLLRAEDFG